MSDITDYISNSIDSVFGFDPDTRILAGDFLTRYSNNIPYLLTELDKLCACSFTAMAGLNNIQASQNVASGINSAITEAGGTTSSDLALKEKVGDADLDTTAKDLSRAVNELYAGGGGGSGGSSSYTPLGTLGSFYEYNSGTYTLIATGSTNLDTHTQAKQNCSNWAVGKFTVLADSYRQPSTAVSFALSNSGIYYQVNQIYSIGGSSFSNVGSIGSLDSLCKWALDH